MNRDLICPGERGEAGYWLVTLPTLVWDADEVRKLAEIIPSDMLQHDLLVAIGDREDEDS